MPLPLYHNKHGLLLNAPLILWFNVTRAVTLRAIAAFLELLESFRCPHLVHDRRASGASDLLKRML